MTALPDRPPADDRRRRRSAVRWLLLGAVLTALVVAGLSWESTTVVHRTQQPASVSYPDGSVHHLAVERHVSIGAAVLGRARHELWLGRDPGLGYGHAVALDFTGADVEQFEALWTEEGVEVRFASGHVIGVPAAAFTGGR